MVFYVIVHTTHTSKTTPSRCDDRSSRGDAPREKGSVASPSGQQGRAERLPSHARAPHKNGWEYVAPSNTAKRKGHDSDTPMVSDQDVDEEVEQLYECINDVTDKAEDMSRRVRAGGQAIQDLVGTLERRFHNLNVEMRDSSAKLGTS